MAELCSNGDCRDLAHESVSGDPYCNFHAAIALLSELSQEAAHQALSAAGHSLGAVREQLDAARIRLRACGTWFREYEHGHRAKGDTLKADSSARKAEYCESFVARTEAAPAPKKCGECHSPSDEVKSNV